MLQLEHREALSERVIVKVPPAFRRRVYAKAASEGKSVSEFVRGALATCMSGGPMKPSVQRD